MEKCGVSTLSPVNLNIARPLTGNYWFSTSLSTGLVAFASFEDDLNDLYKDVTRTILSWKFMSTAAKVMKPERGVTIVFYSLYKLEMAKR